MFEKIKCFILDMDGTIYLGNRFRYRGLGI